MKKFVTGIVISSLIITALILFFYFKYNLPFEFLTAAIYAALLNIINISTAIILFNIGSKKSNKKFLILNFGGMLIRLLLLLSSIIIFIKLLNVHTIGFISVFFVFYFIYLIFEINYFRINAAKNKTFNYVE